MSLGEGEERHYPANPGAPSERLTYRNLLEEKRFISSDVHPNQRMKRIGDRNVHDECLY